VHCERLGNDLPAVHHESVGAERDVGADTPGDEGDVPFHLKGIQRETLDCLHR
jgi:hypothetical protein